MPDLTAVAESVEQSIRPLTVARNLAWWESNTHADDAAERARVETEVALSDFLADGDAFAEIRAAQNVNGADPWAQRRLALLHDAFLPNQVDAGLRRRIVELEAAVEGRFSRHRGVVAGAEVDDNEIKRILRSSNDEAERREAWEAAKTVGVAVADDVRELARIRNTAAQSLGFRDYFALSLATSEFDEERLLSTLTEVDGATASVFERWKARLDDRLAERFDCAVADLRPWHYDDPFFQDLPVEGGVSLDDVFAGRDLVELTRASYDGLGLETRPILERSDLYPRDGKCQHAFCMDVDREGDVRVLANVVDNQYWMDTMLHELGHGVYDAGFDDGLPWGLRSTHLVTTEGIAILMGRLVTDPRWLEGVAGIEVTEADRLAGPLSEARAAELALFARWVLVMTGFERGLYADPDADHDARWWELVSKYQLVTPPDGRAAPDWAAKIHIAVAPVYYHTYLYGNLVASQLFEVLERRFGGLAGSSDAGAYLSEHVFGPGESVRWDHLVEAAIGAPLGAAAYARDLAPLA